MTDQTHPYLRLLRRGGLLALGLLALSGCVAYPVGGYYEAPGYVYAPPPGVYVNGGAVVGYGYYGGWHGRHYRGWR